MNAFAKQYVGLLIDRICELNISNQLMTAMLDDARKRPIGERWKETLEIAMRSPEAHSMRQKFAARRDAILSNIDQEEAIEAMLKDPKRGLPN